MHAAGAPVKSAQRKLFVDGDGTTAKGITNSDSYGSEPQASVTDTDSNEDDVSCARLQFR